jgi:hypothetical protein
MGRKPTLVGFDALMGLVGEFDKLPDFPGEFKLPRPVIEDSVPQTMSLMSKYGSGEWLHDNTVRAMRRRLQKSKLTLDRLQYLAYLCFMQSMKAYEESRLTPA